MKKIFGFLIGLFLCFVLTACDPSGYNFDYDELVKNVLCVELINYENEKQEHFTSWVPDHSNDLLPMDLDKITVVEKLSNNKILDFLEELSKDNLLFKYYGYNSPKDLCIKLSYTNTDFLIIYCYEKSFSGYIGLYSSTGEVKEFYGCFEDYDYFVKLVNNYFEYQI